MAVNDRNTEAMAPEAQTQIHSKQRLRGQRMHDLSKVRVALEPTHAHPQKAHARVAPRYLYACRLNIKGLLSVAAVLQPTFPICKDTTAKYFSPPPSPV